jgi:hypothetical protein
MAQRMTKYREQDSLLAKKLVSDKLEWAIFELEQSILAEEEKKKKSNKKDIPAESVLAPR